MVRMQLQLTLAKRCAGVPAWALPHLLPRVRSSKTSFSQGTLYDMPSNNKLGKNKIINKREEVREKFLKN